jgi:uncharacterized UBP type Zn finger protein
MINSFCIFNRFQRRNVTSNCLFVFVANFFIFFVYLLFLPPFPKLIQMEPEAKRPRLENQASKKGEEKTSTDLYLDTINRHMLDFDFEKVCSVSLSQINVYACLVCGKYYQGRGRSSHAYFHSIDKDHHVFINLSTLKVISF